jgi:hypothetical protein
MLTGSACAVVCLVRPAAAQQEPGLQVGIRGGLQLAQVVAIVRVDGLSGSEGSPRRVDVTGGGFVRQGLHDRLAVQVEAMFSGRGAGGDGGAAVRYLDVPVVVAAPLMRLPSGTTFDVIGGATFGVRLSRASTAGIPDLGLPVIDGDDLVRRIDTALTVGAVLTRGRVVVDVRYLHGLTNLFSPAGVQLLRDILEEFGAEFTTFDLALKHRVVAITIGIRFR